MGLYIHKLVTRPIAICDKGPFKKKCQVSSELVLLYQFAVCCSVTKLCPTLCDPIDCSTPGFPVLHYLPEFAQTSIESVMPSSDFILFCPLLLLPLIFPSIGVFVSIIYNKNQLLESGTCLWISQQCHVVMNVFKYLTPSLCAYLGTEQL